MTNVYQVTTGNWLPSSKKIFNTIEECQEHIKKIIALKLDWINDTHINESCRITMINTKDLPEYRKIFKESDKIKEPKFYKKFKNKNLDPNAPQDQKKRSKGKKTGTTEEKPIVGEKKA
jgi:hypothetical protein